MSLFFLTLRIISQVQEAQKLTAPSTFFLYPWQCKKHKRVFQHKASWSHPAIPAMVFVFCLIVGLYLLACFN